MEIIYFREGEYVMCTINQLCPGHGTSENGASPYVVALSINYIKVQISTLWRGLVGNNELFFKS
jgi:hypothetical protein